MVQFVAGEDDGDARAGVGQCQAPSHPHDDVRLLRQTVCHLDDIGGQGELNQPADHDLSVHPQRACHAGQVGPALGACESIGNQATDGRQGGHAIRHHNGAGRARLNS